MRKRKERPQLYFTVVYLVDINLIVANLIHSTLIYFLKVTSISFHPKEGTTAAPLKEAEGKQHHPQGGERKEHHPKDKKNAAPPKKREETQLYFTLLWLFYAVLYCTWLLISLLLL